MARTMEGIMGGRVAASVLSSSFLATYLPFKCLALSALDLIHIG